MTADGVGSLALYTPDGDQMPGFGRVIFAKTAADKLASVGDICDEGFVFVFDKHGLKTYKEHEIKVYGETFTQMLVILFQNCTLYIYSVARKKSALRNELTLCVGALNAVVMYCHQRLTKRKSPRCLLIPMSGKVCLTLIGTTLKWAILVSRL